MVKAVVEAVNDIVEKTEHVDAKISEIADSIHEEAEIINGITENVARVESFAEKTKETSQNSVAMTQELYAEVNRMHDTVEQFEL